MLHFPRRQVHLGLATVLVSALALPACRKAPGELYEERLAETDKPGQHAIHSEKLAETMHRLERLATERLPQELDPAARRQNGVREISAIARELSAAADYITDLLADVELSAEREEEFTRLAKLLGDRSAQLHEEAPTLSLAQMREKLAEIDESCTACHNRFRILPRAHD